ncbi:HAD-IA family hydrolase [Candidatus Methylospira mobilis]|uniref:HAD-IA family hydrolase n=1 Tax=Candidatus Methylospira mobilis TaxID=1808979 RepID=A0A5Q0BGJ9_9GAMM|nr:HAD-IA family hydrolase [Candidatus Methylospira mobilis]QFY41248.1 HAD-IA family hydrolase [Candidatus Methylospira mobilis]WNV05531.1 HAD-IA family hydrolase [Candidatus Methylospira mobilis]
MKTPFDAVIFDSDGTLVDSESLGNQILVDYVAELGLSMSLEEAITQFRGGKMADTLLYIEQRLGKRLPGNFVVELRARMVTVFNESLKPMPGVKAVLQGLQLPFCVASSGPREKIELSLRATGLLPYFRGRIFSAYELGRWKPEPDIFLHAAKAMAAAPERCAVVEDSVKGVKAGIAAGMTVFGYAPLANNARLEGLGVRLFTHMDELLPLLQYEE